MFAYKNLLTCALLLVACGDDKNESETAATEPPATSTTPMTDPATTDPSGAETHDTAHSTGDDPTTGGPTTDDSATTDPTGALSCEDYCATIMTNCTGAVQQYGAVENCVASCAGFPPGTEADMGGNTLGCRTYHAGAAAMDPNVHCVHAGPGGANACGSNCEGFCAVAQTACPDAWPDAGACMTACGGFADMEPYDASDVGGNTLACRLYHLTAAAVDPATHCGHIVGASPTCVD
jgi:hypothetical protein